MGVPAYMLSVLHRQVLLLEGGFTRRYPWDWLVWEPGPWRPARSELESNLASTLVPTSDLRVPSAHDPICFQLAPPPSGVLRVGRATNNDIVVNDLTASRAQLTLHYTREKEWRLEPGASVFLDDRELSGEVVVRSKQTLRVGDVRLTLLSPTDMQQRASAFQTPPRAP
jgi:hypothetical protein